MTDYRVLTVFAAVLFILFSAASFGDTVVATKHFSGELEHSGAHGDWHIKRGRLYQNDVDNRLAKINFRIPQKGTMEYRFDVRYESGGIEDRMGGFGVHLFVDDAYPNRSWGNGTSYLLWLNYDENANYGKSGFQGQVYKSYNFFEMKLLEDYQLEIPVSYLDKVDNNSVVPVKIELNGDTGEVKVWDPVKDGTYYRFRLDSAPSEGSFVSFRTNSLSVSFDNLVVNRIQ